MVPPLSSFRDSLLAALSDVKASGSFATDGVSADVFPKDAGLFVEGVGRITLPLEEKQAALLVAASAPAPFGRGLDTVVDESVRKARQFDASKVPLGEHLCSTVV